MLKELNFIYNDSRGILHYDYNIEKGINNY